MIKEYFFNVLQSPHVSEKATLVGEKNNQYVFKVAPDATKKMVKMAVEALFEVNVMKVNILNRKPKMKRTHRGYSRRSSIRKAYVTLKSGEEIEFVAGNE